LTLQEKLAAARGGAGGAAPAAAGAKPAGAKPAGAAAAKSAAPAAPARTLPPLDKITDPKDLAEALRQAGAKKEKEAAGPAPKPAAAKAPAREKETKPQTVLPKPTRRVADAAAAVSRRTFLLFSSWIFVGWASFTAGCVAFTAMMGRFMFPNVLAEPPSTIKIGLPTNFEKEEVNERFKAEWGFWIVRSSVYNGTDIIYALKSICTHLGCPPNWLAGEQKFKCPCHGSGFYISGVNFEGPAPRPLERFKLSVGDDGQLVVDKSQLFQQELGQWADPDSFVNA
jgi:cytochrome b6-f complex iron-sulfur subunit